MSKGKAEYTTLTEIKFVKSHEKIEDTAKNVESSHEPI
jgi:hypothetical protein